MVTHAGHVEPPTETTDPRLSFDASGGTVSDAACRAFQQDGVVCLRGVLPLHVVSELQEGCVEAETAASELSYRVGGDGGPSFFYDINVSDRVEAFRRVRDESRIPDMARQLMGSTTLGRYFDNLFVKDAGGGAATPWHEDASFQRVHGTQAVNFWVSLDQIPPETTLQFLAGSHLRDEPIYLMGHFDPDNEYDRPITRDRVPMPPVEELTSRFELIWWELEPGDAVVWLHRTLHAAPANTIPRPRRSIAYVWTGDDAYWNAAPGRVDPDLHDPALSEGDPIRSEMFPAVR